MIRKGLNIPNFDEAYKRLLSENALSKGSKDGIKNFIMEFGKGEMFLESAIKELTEPLPRDFIVKTTPYAKEILETLRKNHVLALVTAGSPRFQMEKLEKAGIDRGIFSNISTPGNSSKKPCYERLNKEFSMSPMETIVCGDRVERDLKPAHELGMQTVHMRFGRGLLGKTDDWVQHQIHTISELKRIITT